MKEKVGLVLEGGSMRGLYSAGILDTFMDEGIKIDGIIGTSAGAIFGPNYFSGQKGRVLRYNKRFCRDLRYMSLPSFIFTGNVINKQFAFYDVTTKYDIFDNDTFMKNNTGFYAAATNVKTGKAEYFEITDVLNQLEELRATSAIPFLSQTVEISGEQYLDGGIADSIPVMKCKQLGYGKIIVVLTRPEDYIKNPFPKFLNKLISLKYKKFPEFIDAIVNRHKAYNKTLEDIKEMEKNKEIFVFRPSEALDVKTVERSAKRLQRAYDIGVEDCKNSIDALKKYLNI